MLSLSEKRRKNENIERKLMKIKEQYELLIKLLKENRRMTRKY